MDDLDLLIFPDFSNVSKDSNLNYENKETYHITIDAIMEEMNDELYANLKETVNKSLLPQPSEATNEENTTQTSFENMEASFTSNVDNLHLFDYDSDDSLSSFKDCENIAESDFCSLKQIINESFDINAADDFSNGIQSATASNHFNENAPNTNISSYGHSTSHSRSSENLVNNSNHNMEDVEQNAEEMEIEVEDTVTASSSNDSVLMPTTEPRTDLRLVGRVIPQPIILDNLEGRQKQFDAVMVPKNNDKMRDEKISKNYFVLFNDQKFKLGDVFTMNLNDLHSAELVVEFPALKDVEEIHLNNFILKIRIFDVNGEKTLEEDHEIHIGERAKRDLKRKRAALEPNGVLEMTLANEKQDRGDDLKVSDNNFGGILNKKVPTTSNFTSNIVAALSVEISSYIHEKNLISCKPHEIFDVTVKASLPNGKYYWRLYVKRPDIEPSVDPVCSAKCNKRNEVLPIFDCYANGVKCELTGDSGKIYPNERLRYEFPYCDKFSLQFNCWNSCHLNKKAGILFIELINENGDEILARRVFPYKTVVRKR